MKKQNYRYIIMINIDDDKPSRVAFSLNAWQQKHKTMLKVNVCVNLFVTSHSHKSV